MSHSDADIDTQALTGVWTAFALPARAAVGPVAGWVKLLRVHA